MVTPPTFSDSVARVVLVEDHTLVRQLMSELVRKDLALSVVADCCTVSDAVTACLREKPDLVIIDWMLPDGLGFEVVRTAGPKLPKTRWLFISSNEQEHMVREAISLGVHGFVLKRSDLSLLREAIHKVLAGESFYCPASSRLLVESLRSEASTVGSNLTPREREVLRGFARGENVKAMALRLEVSPKTINNVLSQVKEKLGQFEPADLVRYAIKHGYVEEP
ncbi:MAG TPA: response regulator transcription factor [Opitutaceae bacterium]|nr:response regulator transcription factor [Opitutaceae bacterium]